MTLTRGFERPRKRVRSLLHRYGLGLLFAANIFGAGSVYILTETGVEYGLSHLWVLPASLLVGLAVHEMSARLAALDEPLMEFVRAVTGPALAKAFAVTIAFVMQFWSVANYGLSGAILTHLTPLDSVLVGTVVSGAAGLVLVELRLYRRIEAFIAALVLVVFGSYLAIFAGLEVPTGPVASGFVPAVRIETGYLTFVIAMLGTTIYYPNFFIQSSIQDAKEWEAVERYRRDHTVGLAVAVLLSIAVLVVAAVTVPAGEPTVVDPATPLVEMIGPWALVVFLVGAGAASFSSATGTLFGAGFMVPQAFGHDTSFGDRRFRSVIHALIVLSVVLAAVALTSTDLTPVQLAILMPAVNGVIGLPLTALALFGAVIRYCELSRTERLIFAAAVFLMFAAAGVTLESLLERIAAWS